MPIEIRPLTADDAPAAARLHLAGQPGTFLSRLGQPFLRALYRGFATCEHSYSYVAILEGQAVGIIVGTDDTAALYRTVYRRYLWQLLGPVLLGMVRDPRLIGLFAQSLRYPEQEKGAPGVGEFLFIGVDPAARQHGVGRLMFEHLVAECQGYGLHGLFLTVDVTNETAIRFHERNGFVRKHTATVIGRPMHYCERIWG
jgi:ribosomal protein S18 acetylase RimI-like enzyme